ncbi:MAG: DUF6316 family protein [Pseudomonadales bacterium]
MSDKPSNRKSDSPFHDPTQSSRFVEIGGKWYFLTRERNLQGPYATKAGAEVALDVYLNEGISSSRSKQENAKLQSYDVDEVQHANVIDWQSAKANIIN